MIHWMEIWRLNVTLNDTLEIWNNVLDHKYANFYEYTPKLRYMEDNNCALQCKGRDEHLKLIPNKINFLSRIKTI